MTQAEEPPVHEVPSATEWRQRAVDRSLQTAKLRASERVQRFLDAAQAIITEKGSTDFTVQEVVDRSRQSLRSFYLQFDGKHALLMTLYEDALTKTVAQIRAASSTGADPMDRLRTAVQLLFQVCRPDPQAHRPLFTEFAPRLSTSHPTEVRLAHASLFALFTELMADVADVDLLSHRISSRRLAAMTIQTVMSISQSVNAEVITTTAEEVWEFCAYGMTRT